MKPGLPPRARLLAIALALLAGIAFAISVQRGPWWAIGEAEVGPFGAQRCGGGTCAPAGLAWLGGGERWIRIGMATWAAGMIALVLLVVMAAAIAAKRVPRLVAKTVLVSIATAGCTGGALFAMFPGDEFPAATIQRGVWLFAIAIVLGTTSAIMVLRTKR